MFNHIVDIFGISIYSYGVLTAIGYLIGIWLITREAARAEIDPKIIIEMAFPILIWTVIGARLLYILTNIPSYIDMCKVQNDCFAIARVWEGGLVFYGGLIGGFSAAMYYIRKHKLNTFKVLDVLAIGMPIGHAIGRLGCFSAGCCYGHETDSLLGVSFPKNSIPFNDQVLNGTINLTDTHSLNIHPTQLYEALGVSIIFLILWLFRSRKKFHGQIGLLYVILYSIERSIVEIFRGDGIRKHLFKYSPESLTDFLGLPKGSAILLSTSQFISLLIIIVASGFMIFLSKKAKNKIII
jgi:phosphatidylglycerol:prolipoprotein diacylglycerol transferase